MFIQGSRSAGSLLAVDAASKVYLCSNETTLIVLLLNQVGRFILVSLYNSKCVSYRYPQLWCKD